MTLATDRAEGRLRQTFVEKRCQSLLLVDPIPAFTELKEGIDDIKGIFTRHRH